MSTNLQNVDNLGYATISDKEFKEFQTVVVDLLRAATEEGTQEITIISSEPISFKSKGVLAQKLDIPVWTDDTFNFFLEHIAYLRLDSETPSTKNQINTKFFDKVIKANDYSKDFAVSVKGKTLRIHAVSIYNGAGKATQSKYCFTIRVVPNEIPDYSTLNLPKIFEKATTLESGLILISGHAGSGKTTTVASLIKAINTNPAMKRSVLTVEDPIEFVHESSQALVLQRALGINTGSYTDATRDALRENVDTVVIGELREMEAMDNAIRLAEMGKLVFATVHSNSPAETIDRIVNEFSGDLQDSVRARLAETVVGILHQNLEVIRDEEANTDTQIPVASGFLIQNASQKAKLRNDFSRENISNIIKSENWAVSYDVAYDELVKNKAVKDNPENRKKLVPA